MMRQKIYLGGVLLLGFVGYCLLATPGQAQAQGLQIRPHIYRAQLQPGEVKKGYVDISNPSHAPVALQLRVTNFSQIDGEGRLDFSDYDIPEGSIRLDLDELELGPREAARVYFLLDSARLPQGDVFLALFAGTKPDANAGINPSAQVGTLLILQNGPATPRKAEIERLSISPLQFGTAISGQIVVKNVTTTERPSAFFPSMRVSVSGAASLDKRFEGPLIFAGISRSVPFSAGTGSHIGVARVRVEAQGVSKEASVLLITGFWRILLPVLLLAAVAGLFGRKWLRKGYYAAATFLKKFRRK